MNDTSTAISRTADRHCTVATFTHGNLLNPQPYESPVEGWVEGVYHPTRKLGRIIELSILAAGYSSGRLWEKPSCKHGRS